MLGMSLALNACGVWSFQAPFKFMFCMLARHKMRLEQQLEHGFCYFYGKPCSSFRHEC